MSVIFHITTRAAWNEAVKSGIYRSDTLDEIGFIHASEPHQVAEVANRLFPGRDDLVVAKIDEESLEVDVVRENLEGEDEMYPHIYGPLSIGSVLDVIEFRPEEDGLFRFPVGAW